MKKIFILLLLLALPVVFFAIGVNVMAKGDRVPGPTQTAQAVPTAIVKPDMCRVNTGVDAGTVNLRACGSIACKVMDTLTEGESLTIVKVGSWAQVIRADGVTGWLNSKYCKGE